MITSPENYCSNMNNNLNSYYAAWTLTPNANCDFNNILSNQNYQQQSYNQINNNIPYNFNNVNINNCNNNQNFYFANSHHFQYQNNQAKEMSFKVYFKIISGEF